MYREDVSATTGARPLPEPLERRLAELPDEPRREALASFSRALLRRAPEPWLERLGDTLWDQVSSLYALVGARREPIAVRVVEAAGGSSVLELNVADAPFLVDTVRAAVEAQGLAIDLLLHPVLGIERSPDGSLARILPAREASTHESVMYVELDRRLEADGAEALRAEVSAALDDLALAVADFSAMTALVSRMVESARNASARYPSDEIDEVVAFLEWLRNHHFVFLGAREYDLVPSPEGARVAAIAGSGLGILRDPRPSSFSTPVPVASLEPALRERLEGGDLLLISKTNRTATVHRRERMDDITVKRIGPDGAVLGQIRLLGQFTRLVYMEQAERTPVLRRKLRQLLEREDLFKGSHDYKAAVSIFESFPRDELFQAGVDDLRVQVMSVLSAEGSDRVTLQLRPDPVARTTTVLIAMPRDRFNGELRMRLQALLAGRFGASAVEYHLSLTEGNLAQLFFTMHPGEGDLPVLPQEELEAEVRAACRSWDDEVADLLSARLGDHEGGRLAARYAGRLPSYYKSATAPAIALLDIEQLERVERGEPFSVALQNESSAQTMDGSPPLTRLALAKQGDKVQLGQFLPLLEDIGLTVVEEVPTRVADGAGVEAYLHDFGVLIDGVQVDTARSGGLIADAVSAAWRGETLSDTLSRLVARADVPWRDVAVLRAYRRYRQLVSPTFTESYQNDVLVGHAETTRLLLELFHARFAPQDGGEARAAELHAAIEERLEAVTSLDEDRILRGFLGLIDATLRTNAFLPERSWLAFKFASAAVPQMPRPFPLYEIFVWSPSMEGIHLRGGPVARGGIRWSDRREDYRTEVLGLMKAQMVKNAVIVPVGSKGGFVLRSAPAERGELQAEVRRRYSTLIRGLLDLTDNIVAGEVVHPQGVRVYDGDDPYLVVAADKGTATFSDLANSISAEYGFWLGDAFASGGSHGYDHKTLGITARGAWECVRRHFRELGHDVQARPFTVVGIGDMSGDVFGNGMLLSDQIRLIGAFDHRHVFLDPDPDPARSFAERERLFVLGAGTSWDDYDRSAISAGGGVFPRSVKSIELGESARAALGVEADRPDPQRADPGHPARAGRPALERRHRHVRQGRRRTPRTPATARTTASAWTPASCAHAWSARAATSASPSPARVEYALGGGRINTDAIDNSAGVDCSDHEVNIKILVGLGLEHGLLAADGRDGLLASLADDVCRKVLYDNYLQVQILSQEEAAAGRDAEAHEELMRELEADHLLDRQLEFLPSSEAMAERARTGRGLTRPELCVLLAYAKRRLLADVSASSLPDDPYLDLELRRYFPPRLIEATGELYRLHRLRREIVATVITNDVVNSLGTTWVWRCAAETGAEPADVVRAFWVARSVSHAVERWAEVEALFADPRIDTSLQMELMDGVDWLVAALARWYLRNAALGDLETVIERDEPAFVELAAGLKLTGSPEWRAERALRREALVAQGIPHDVAEASSWHHELIYAPDIIAAARGTGRTLSEAADTFFRLGERLHLDWLELQLESVTVETRWQRWAVAAIAEDLHLVRREVTERVLAASHGEAPDETIERFLADRGEPLSRLERLLETLRAEGLTDLAAATVALRQVRAALA